MKLISSYMAFVCIVVLGYVLVGCAAKTRQVLAPFAITYPAPQKEADVSVPETLMVYQFLLARSVPLDSLVVVKNSGGAESVGMFKWEENPADMLTQLLIRDLKSSGIFGRVVDQLSSVRYRYAFEGAIRTLQGEIRDAKAKAVIDFEAILTDFEAPSGMDKTIFKKVYTIESPASDPSPESILRALNEAAKDLSVQLRADLLHALENPSSNKDKNSIKSPACTPRKRSAI